MRLTRRHLRWLVALVAAHSLAIGVMLTLAPVWTVRFAGWSGAQPVFFVRQAGAFHFVVAAGYLIEQWRYGGVSFLVTTKTIAFVFLAVLTMLGGVAWSVPFSAAADGLMGLVVLVVSRAVTSPGAGQRLTG